MKTRTYFRSSFLSWVLCAVSAIIICAIAFWNPWAGAILSAVGWYVIGTYFKDDGPGDFMIVFYIVPYLLCFLWYQLLLPFHFL